MAGILKNTEKVDEKHDEKGLPHDTHVHNEKENHEHHEKEKKHEHNHHKHVDDDTAKIPGNDNKDVEVKVLYANENAHYHEPEPKAHGHGHGHHGHLSPEAAKDGQQPQQQPAKPEEIPHHKHKHNHKPEQNKVKHSGSEGHVKFTNTLPVRRPGDPPIKVIALINEGTQTHPVTKSIRQSPSAHDHDHDYDPDDMCIPYWQIELVEGKEHLKHHYEAYVRAHTAHKRMALKPAAKDVEEDIWAHKSKATIFSGSLPDCVSPGLQYLNQIDRVFFQHKVEVTDGVAPCCDTKRNKYEIINGHGHKMFQIQEEESKSCLGRRRLLFTDSNRLEVVQMVKKWTWKRKKFEMYSPPGYLIGSIEQSWHCRRPEYHIKDFQGTLILLAQLDGTLCCGVGKIEQMAFMLLTARRNPRGRLAGDWPDLKRTMYSTEDAYGVHFPGEMSVVWKTLVMGVGIMAYDHYYDKMKKIVHHPGKGARRLVDYEIERRRESSRTTAASNIVLVQ